MQHNTAPSAHQSDALRRTLAAAGMAGVALLAACSNETAAAPAEPAPSVSSINPSASPEPLPSEPQGDTAPTEDKVAEKIMTSALVDKAIEKSCQTIIDAYDADPDTYPAVSKEDELGNPVLRVNVPVGATGLLEGNFNPAADPAKLTEADCVKGIKAFTFSSEEIRQQHLEDMLGDEDSTKFAFAKLRPAEGEGGAYNVLIYNFMGLEELPDSSREPYGVIERGWQKPSKEGVDDVRNQMGEAEAQQIRDAAEFVLAQTS